MNKYEKANQLKGVFTTTDGQGMSTTEKVKRSALKTLVHTGSAIIGGFTGAGINNGWSVALGLSAIAAGEFTGIYPMTTFGIGAITGVTASAMSGRSAEPPKTGIEGAKQRMKQYGQSIKEKFLLDKIFKKKTSDAGATTTTTTTTENNTNVSGIGEVKVFTPSGKGEPFDVSQMEHYERELQKSAEAFQSENSSENNSQNPPAVNGLDDSFKDVNERLM